MIDKLTASGLTAGNHAMIAEMERMRAEATAAQPMPAWSAASLSTPSFSSVLEQAVDHVDRLQQSASDKQQAVDMGTSDDLTGAILESQKASVAFSALLQVRNKLTTAFDDVMNLSI